MRIKEKLMVAGAHLLGLAAQEQDHHNPEKTITPGMPELLRSVAAQGAVLLENRALPLSAGTRISVFGRVQCDYFYTGYGSGGDVNYPYSISLLEGLRSCESLEVNENLAKAYELWVQANPADHGAWGMWPRFHREMPVTDALVAQAREESDTAVVVLGRASGEDRENLLEEGSYYLTEEENALLAAVTRHFPDAILVLNIGSIMDFSFLKDYSFGAVLLPWQGGMESGNAVADLLCGKRNPSGRLTATIANSYFDYPSAEHFGNKDFNEYFEDIYVGYRWFETFGKDKVLYPFGHGLSYTTFDVSGEQVGDLTFRVTVTNTGSRSGRNAVMLFVQKPCTHLGNPARELVAFGKTGELAPGESEEITLTATRYQLSSYDDAGLTGHKSCYVLQEGLYSFYCGENVRDAAPVGSYSVDRDTVLKRHREAAAPAKAFPILAAEKTEEGYIPVRRTASAKTANLKKRILASIPKAVPQTGDKGYKLKDVKEGKVSLDAFVAQLDKIELEAISRGDYSMNSPLGPLGNAGTFGGVTESLRKKGVPAVTTTDGPSGIRLYDSCSLMPIGMLLASTFDMALLEQLYAEVGKEMKARGTDVLLAPGMNIQRNVLCGRNFEYFSEDPYVSGRMAAAVVRGIQSQGVSACPKHFACNNQEVNRHGNDSILSERALREIYLRGFEICVKQASPKNLMASYNKINGIWGHYHFDLVKTILRDEWGYKGNVITDWWMRYAPSPEFPQLTGNAYRVRSRVDVLMPGGRSYTDKRRRHDGTLLATFGKPDGITLGEMQECARNVLRCVMDLKEL